MGMTRRILNLLLAMTVALVDLADDAERNRSSPCLQLVVQPIFASSGSGHFSRMASTMNLGKTNLYQKSRTDKTVGGFGRESTGAAQPAANENEPGIDTLQTHSQFLQNRCDAQETTAGR
jgi:hypothetical protein